MIPPINSLVKYDKPILISSIAIGKKNKAQSNVINLEDGKKNTPTEDILHSILPPREWTSHGDLWVQYVSSHPATRVDSIQLQVRTYLSVENCKTDMFVLL